MRLRIGLVAGFAAGAYIATIAQQRSRELSRQMSQKVTSGLRQTAIDTVTAKAKAVVDQGKERARDIVVGKLDNGLVRPLVQTPSRLAAQQRNGTKTP
jgi:hypothetical protein